MEIIYLTENSCKVLGAEIELMFISESKNKKLYPLEERKESHILKNTLDITFNGGYKNLLTGEKYWTFNQDTYIRINRLIRAEYEIDHFNINSTFNLTHIEGSIFKYPKQIKVVVMDDQYDIILKYVRNREINKILDDE